MSAGGKRFPLQVAREIAVTLLEELAPECLRIEIAGSIRREKETVGDIELVYVSKSEAEADLFGNPVGFRERADMVIESLLDAGVLAKRKNVKGSEIWGAKNKLAVHVESGIPVDLFATSQLDFANYLVCRTGPGDLNKEIAMRAQRRGLKWHPYGFGFERLSDGEPLVMQWEADVFKTVGLPWMDPNKRDDWEAQAAKFRGQI